jgi:gamma-glutamyl-gamma-aminobutyrate hydrolase PuuD
MLSIGVLSQPLPADLSAILPPGHNFTSYISSCYIKWVESAGARAAPIIATEEEAGQNEYLTEVLSGVSGVLLPGGGSSIHTSSYARVSNYIYQLAIKVKWLISSSFYNRSAGE